MLGVRLGVSGEGDGKVGGGVDEQYAEVRVRRERRSVRYGRRSEGGVMVWMLVLGCRR